MSSSRAPAPTPTTLLNQKRASPPLSEPDSLITPPATVTQSIASRYTQIHNQIDSGTRLPATDFQIQVDVKRGLWGFCGTAEDDVGRCWMPGSCFDEDECKDGCGALDRKDLSTASCLSKDSSGSTIRASICATAYLTLDNGLGPFQYIACGWTTTRTHYTASQADAAGYVGATTTSSSGSSSTSLSSASTVSTPSQPSIASPTGNSGNNSNIGAIVGGVMGSLAIIGAFIFAAYLVWIYRIRDRRKQPRGGSEPLNGDGSGRTSEDNTPTPLSNLSYSPDGQHYGPGPGPGPGHGAGAGHGQAEYGVPFVSMGEMEQRRVKDAEGGWGPRELDSGFERGGYAHEQGQSGPYEVLSVEKVAEMPVRFEPVEMSSGWEDHPGRDGREGSYGHELGTETNGGRRR